MDFESIQKLSDKEILNLYENVITNEYLSLCMCYTKYATSGCLLFVPNSTTSRCCSADKVTTASECSNYCVQQRCRTENTGWANYGAGFCSSTGNKLCNRTY